MARMVVTWSHSSLSNGSEQSNLGKINEQCCATALSAFIVKYEQHDRGDVRYNKQWQKSNNIRFCNIKHQ